MTDKNAYDNREHTKNKDPIHQENKPKIDSSMKYQIIQRNAPGMEKRLREAKVAIAGLGGLGSNIAVALARTGVGNLLLVDDDVVEPSNLNRQTYTLRHLGKKKTEALAEQLAEINPFIRVDARQERVTDDNALAIFEGVEILCEAFDDPQTKAMLVNTILTQRPTMKLVCGSGMAGYDSSNRIRTEQKMKNLYICGDQVSEYEEQTGIMMPRVMICAGHQANMVLRLLMGREDV